MTPRAPASPRARLAELATEVAGTTAGVRSASAFAAAISGGRFGVELHLIAELVPLRPLAERVRSAVEAATTAAGLEAALGPVDIAVDDVVEAGEVGR